MTATYQQLISDSYLRSIFDKEYRVFRGGDAEKALLERLHKWSGKAFQKETSAEGAFVQLFFEETWGYVQSGKQHAGSGFTCYPKFPVGGAGQGGGTGEADAALAHFNLSGVPPTPQVLCEFKDVRSNLDAPQKRKGNKRSPVKQCADYLREAMRPLFGNETVQPTWGLVTDMNEFRLYWRNTMPSQYQRFIIKKATTDEGTSLLAETEAGSFQRFLFAKLFHAESLLTKGGPSELLKLLKEQRYQEKEIENAFYREYKSYREHLVNLLIKHNPKFPGTKGRLVRLAQKLIDRCLFVLFCEDMGEQLSFPPNALRDYLSELSKTTTFEADEGDAWSKLKELFHAMNEGKKFRARTINRFNGGLFASDAELDALRIPNDAFCAKQQGENDETLRAHPLTLLFFAGTYNFGASGREGEAITLYTLGRIFEQSITELEALEAAVEKRESLTVISKRKRDGVYYTPEWVVERIVAETLGPRLDEIRGEVGWSFELEGDEGAIGAQFAKSPSSRSAAFLKHADAVRKFRDRLDTFTVLDPACGSGAFLIYVLEYLLRERRRVGRELALVTGGKREELFEFRADEEVRQILSKNIFGVDINAASVEIAKLALWLHTAKSDQPLSNLDAHIIEGNSLIDSEIFHFKKDLLGAPDSKKETINALDYEKRFAAVFDPKRPGGAGFDCIVSNPPYVKLQNFKKVYPEAADFLRNATGKGGIPRFQSCQTGNFDIYLPFIERGLELLNPHGRLGYIAPSVWRYNEYGDGLRNLLHKGGHLDRWVDFGSFQVFDDVSIYTALQFYSKQAHDRVRFALAPTGELARIHDWDDPSWFITYKELPKSDTWIFVPRHERRLLDKVSNACRRLDNPAVTKQIFQGLITSADHIYSLNRVGQNLYQYQPPKPENSTVRPPPEKVVIEDAIMHPLVSGPEAGRYEVPVTSTFILFPYCVDAKGARLLSERELSGKYPNAWKFLKRFEKILRARESGGFDDEAWYRFSRNQSLDKQEERKLIVAQTVKSLSVCPDDQGAFYLNNVRVNGILPANGDEFWYLLAILNSRVANWVFQRIAKPKEGGYFEANKQFIAPIPIPTAKPDAIAQASSLARQLAELYTTYRDVITDIERRLLTCAIIEQPKEWLWPRSVMSANALKLKAPSSLRAREKTAWAKAEHKRQIATQRDLLVDVLRPSLALRADLAKGELSVTANNTKVIDGVFVDGDDAQLALIGWRHFLRTHRELDASALADGLCKIPQTENKAVQKQLSDLDGQAMRLEQEIAGQEEKLNQLAYKLFNLTEGEIALIAAGRGQNG